MKKIILIPALLTASLVMAQSTFEFTPQLGYNFAEKNLHLKDYTVFGGEVQYNGFNSPFRPELSYYYSLADYEDNFENFVNDADTNVMRFALNGVYEFKKIKNFTPLAKAGFGYETMDSAYGGNNDGSGFLDAGAGVKIPFNDTVSFKLEAIYMVKYNEARYDNNLLIMAGINFAFNTSSHKAAPKVVAPIAPKPVKVVDNDRDKDGVLNMVDKCPNTPLHSRVDAKGCAEMVTLHANFKSDSVEMVGDSTESIDNFVEFMKIQKQYKVKLVGYCDNSGNSAHNLELSKQRAKRVKEILEQKGIAADRIITIGRGDANPVASNATVAGRAQNRRIEAELIK